LTKIEERIAAVAGCDAHPDEVELVGMLTMPEPEDKRCHLGLHVDTNGERPFRYATAIIYLTDVAEGCGGSTVFPLAEGPGFCPEVEHFEALQAASDLLDKSIDHTDRALVRDQGGPEAKVLAQRLVERGEDGTAGVSVRPQKGSMAIFWTRNDQGEIDPYSWHGGERLLGSKDVQKCTLQKFKEIPAQFRDRGMAEFVCGTRKRAGQ